MSSGRGFNIQPPGGTTLEELRAWVQSTLLPALSSPTRIGSEAYYFDRVAVAPPRPRDGEERYADGVNWNPGSGLGLYAYLDGAWRLLSLEDAPADGKLYGRRNNAWSVVTSVFVGAYDQVADNVVGGVGTGSPLAAATGFTDGEYYVLTKDGNFSTAIPELNGLYGVANDRIVAASGQWIHISQSQSFLSRVIDDTAAGVITFGKAPVGGVAAAAANELIRKGESDAGDAAVQADLDSHKGNTGNPHVVTHAQLSDKGTNTHAQIDAHIATGNIHFPDAPSDDIGYVRRNGAWVPATNKAILYGTPDSATLGTGGFTLAGWTGSAEHGELFGSVADPATGVMTIPATGVYTTMVHVHGDQGNNTKEESIWLDFRVNGSEDIEIAHESVDTDKTSSRTLSCVFTREFTLNDTLEMRLRASAGLGTFVFVACTFELAQLR